MNFLDQVKKAISQMGTAPYDDKKTMDYATESSRKTSELCNKLKAEQLRTGK